MVGNHVSQRSRHIKVPAPLFYAHGLGHGDLHVVNKAVVPDRLKNAVAEAKDQDVLDRFLSQVVINAVNLFLSQDFLDLAVELACRLQIVPKGFSKTSRRQCPSFSIASCEAPSCSTMSPKNTGLVAR